MYRCATIMLTAAALAGCATGPKPQPEAMEGEEQTVDDILDAPIPEREKPERTASLSEAMLLLPETPQKPARTIDAKDDDWDRGKFRRFETKDAVESGLTYWSGRSDASFRVGVDADEGFLYFIVQVKDDEIVQADMGEDPTDGVVLWLRDPGLDALGDALPGNVGLGEYIDAETAILFHPNGRVEAWGAADELAFNEIMFHEVRRAPNGYVLEVALKLEAFEEVSSIPLPEIAFRVEVLDGDEQKRPGPQTVLSTLPDRGDDSPRLATYTVGGLLPHKQVGAPPPRVNAIGRWKVEDDAWNFVSFEVIPKYWATLEDMEGFEKVLLENDSLKDVCRTARKDIHLVEAYQSRGGGYRAGLVLCGERAQGSKCPRGAETNVFLVGLRDDDDEWLVDYAVNVFKKPVSQCTYAPLRGENYYAHFALFPLDVLSSTVWAVGWTRTLQDQGRQEETYGVTMLNTKYDSPHLGTTTTRNRVAQTDERTIGTSSVYLTYVDEDDNVDICQVEDYVEQGCSGLNRGCRTYDHGQTVLTHIQMWNTNHQKFERYELSKHKNCTARFDFSDADGFLILQLKNRIGLLPSPRTNDESEETEKLELF